MMTAEQKELKLLEIAQSMMPKNSVFYITEVVKWIDNSYVVDYDMYEYEEKQELFDSLYEEYEESDFFDEDQYEEQFQEFIAEKMGFDNLIESIEEKINSVEILL